MFILVLRSQSTHLCVLTSLRLNHPAVVTESRIKALTNNALHHFVASGSRVIFLLAFHPAPRPFDPEYPANHHLFLRFQPVCAKFRQSVMGMTACEILGWEGTDYENVMDVSLGSAAR